MNEQNLFIIRPRAMLLGKPVFHVLAQVGETTPKLIAVCPWMEDAVRVAEALAKAEDGQVVSELEEHIEAEGIELEQGNPESHPVEDTSLPDEGEPAREEIPPIEEDIVPEEMTEEIAEENPKTDEQ